MADCELCSEGYSMYGDDFVRAIDDGYVVYYVCWNCLRKIQVCKRCRYYDQKLKKCELMPKRVTKAANGTCGQYKQSRLFTSDEVHKIVGTKPKRRKKGRRVQQERWEDDDDDDDYIA